MIYSLIHPGSGLGNQLFRYVAGKVMAVDRFMDYSAIGRENFKGAGFMNLDFGLPNQISYSVEMPAGKIVINDALSRDNYIIDDEFQSPLYWNHRIDEIREWLRVEHLKMPDNKCIIGFRGGEFALFPELFLTKEYWDEAIKLMKKKHHYMTFEVHTDDPKLAQQFFPGYECIHDIGLNWRSIRCAKHLIIANSSFYILPALLNEEVKEVIAPRYWARRNTKEWSRPDNYYGKFTYI